MANYKYIKKGNKLIKADLKAVLLYYDYFSPGIMLPKYIDCRISRYLCHKVLRIIIVLSFSTKLHRLKYETITLRDDFIIKIIGKGGWSNEVTLREENDNLFIYKKVKNSEVYNKEKRFYELYKNNKSRIKLPEHVFLANNLIKIRFINLYNLSLLINKGVVNYKNSLKIYNNISIELEKFYSNKEEYLIHGDLGPLNVFPNFKKKYYYLIDYSDSFLCNLDYDKYILFRSILVSFRKIKQEEGMEKTRDNRFKKEEEIYFNRRKLKHPDIYR